MVFTAVPSVQFAAVRVDGDGNGAGRPEAWMSAEDPPDIASPVSDGKYIWAVHSGGVLTCYPIDSNRVLGSKRLRLSFRASLSIAGGRLYLLADNGTMLILEATPEAREVARCKLPDRTLASPAFAGGRIYIRGAKHLYCIGTR
jgi:hypothetical protein